MLDIFVIDANSSQYNWRPTQDGTGSVVYNLSTSEHDIVFHNDATDGGVSQFERIQFNDRTVDLISEPGSG